MPDLWSLFGEMWTYPFMVRGIAVTLVAGIACAIVSCWLVLIGWSLMGDALSHAILPGVVIAYLLGLPFSIGAMAAALLVVGMIFAVRGTSRVKSDASMGIVFTTMFATGLVIVSKNPRPTCGEDEYLPHVGLGDAQHVLFGDLLGITQADMWQVLVLAPLAAAVLLFKRRDVTAYAFDPGHLRAIGLSPRRISGILVVCLALTVVSAMQAVGAILIVTLLVTPGATAYLLTSRFSRMLVVAPALSAATTITGIYVSYWFDTASGATVVTVGGIVFLAVWALSPHGLRGYLSRWRQDGAEDAG